MTTRKQIRDVIVGIIGAVNLGLTVRSGRVLSYPASELPGVSVYFETGTSESINMRGDRMITATLRTDFTDSNTGGDDALDLIADDIADAVLGSAVLHSICKRVQQSGFDYVRDEQSPYVTLSYSFEVIYLVD